VGAIRWRLKDHLVGWVEARNPTPVTLVVIALGFAQIILVGWVEARNPTPVTLASIALGFARLNPTYRTKRLV